MLNSMNRREFLNSFMPESRADVLGHPQNPREIIVTIFLRGGCDAISFISPISGKDREIYESERPNIGTPKEGTAAALKLDERLGLHPSAKELHSLYQKKKLAVVCAAGLTCNNRSHFDAQMFMEVGTPDSKATSSGWITRFLQKTQVAKDENNSISLAPRFRVPAVAVGNLLPTSLLAFPQAMILNNLNGFNLARFNEFQEDELLALSKMYGGNQWLDNASRQTLSAIHTFGKFKEQDEKIGQKINYPKSDLANKLKTLAQLLRMDLGIRTAAVDMGGWDTHKYQGSGLEGSFHNQVEQLSQAIDAFYTDLEKNSLAVFEKVTLIVMTEFGRRLKENANRGTDHGHGGMMLILGERVHGGKVYGNWPGLETSKLYERADLAVTTDFRQVLSEVVLKGLPLNAIQNVFPGFKLGAKLGIV